MSANDAKAPGVQSVSRTLDILETLAASDRPLGITDIARQLNLAQATAHRLLTALVARGYVRQHEDRRYHLGLAAARLADRAHAQFALGAQPYLQSLVEQIGETANLAVLEGTSMVYIAQAPSPHTLRIFAEVGRRVPVHSTAVGKAVLSNLDDDAERDRIIASLTLEQRTEYTVGTAEGLTDLVEQVRTDGYAVDEQEQELGVRCVGAPLTPTGSWRAAISVSGPAERFTRQRVAEAAPLLVAAAEKLSAALVPPAAS